MKQRHDQACADAGRETDWPQHCVARVTHARRGDIRHAFTYNVDYLLLTPEAATGPALLSFERFNLASFHSRDHGGPRGAGRGVSWARDVLTRAGLTDQRDVAMRLLTQPRFLGIWFTPVSFWLAFRGGAPIALIAEVNNTFGQRHSYLCHLPDFAPLDAGGEMETAKVFHVSPFQDVAGKYRFRLQLKADKLTLRIRQIDGDEGLVATMVGRLGPLGNAHLLVAAVRGPLWPLRTLALIHWHALRLWLKGARYRPLPAPPDQEVSP
jgi:uncharacterized protein